MSAPSIVKTHTARAGLWIAEALRRAIVEGDLRPNEQLPPIGELARNYGATPVTVRRALRRLEEEGLVRVVHGAGSFVADWSGPFDLPLLPGLREDMAARRLRIETEVRGRDAAAVEPAAARALRVAPERALGRLVRRRRIEGAPVVFQRSYLEPGLRALVEAYAPEESLYALIRERSGRAPVSAEEAIQAVALPEDAAEALEEPPGAPGFRSIRLACDAAGRPLVYDEVYLAGSRVELRVRRRGAQTALEYGLLGAAEEGIAEPAPAAATRGGARPPRTKRSPSP